jgi:recombination protein RecA
MGEIIDLGVKCGLVEKSGAWYAYRGDKIGQGKSTACEYLREHPEIATEIDTQLRAKLLGGDAAVIPATAAADVEYE